MLKDATCPIEMRRLLVKVYDSIVLSGSRYVFIDSAPSMETQLPHTGVKYQHLCGVMVWAGISPDDFSVMYLFTRDGEQQQGEHEPGKIGENWVYAGSMGQRGRCTTHCVHSGQIGNRVWSHVYKRFL